MERWRHAYYPSTWWWPAPAWRRSWPEVCGSADPWLVHSLAPGLPNTYNCARLINGRARGNPMSSFQNEEPGRLRRHLVEQAIALAMQNRWADAAKVNQSILDAYPDDTDALNRLGRAYTELGRYREARESYQKTVQRDPSNNIARKNLARLASLKVEQAPPSDRKSTRLNSSHSQISYAVFCLKKK